MAAGDIKIFAEKHNPRPAIVLEGVDDFVQVDAWGTDRQTAADTVGTITAWVMPEAKDASYTIIAAGDVNADEFIDFGIISGKLSIVVSDAATTDLDVISTAVVVEPHVWTHVAVVQNATRPTLYVNGVAVAMTDTTATDLTSWFDQMSGIDAANIGILDANTSTTQDFAGAIGRVRHWNAALTAAEVKNDYAERPQSAATDALQISNWEWGVDLLDSWAGANNGTAVSAAVLDPQYTNMTSQLKVAETLVADDISMSFDGERMFAVVVKAA
ncbi:MAG: LamG domain-containing protein [Patescibacteria group bacterium]|nr:LamG domain-containing protein [Patescibacteria group bacterium]